MEHSKTFEDILLCRPEFMDPTQGGLWWCEGPEDVHAVKLNAVCLAGLAKWEEVKLCEGFISEYKYILAASRNREFIDKLRHFVPWVPILSPKPECFGGAKTVGELADEIGNVNLERRLMLGAAAEPSSGLLNLAAVKHRDLKDIPRTLSGIRKLDMATGGFRAGEMSIWTGKRGEGKSTFLGQILLEGLDQGHKICAYSGELVAERFKDWITAQAAGPAHIDRTPDPDTGAEQYAVREDAVRRINAWWDKKFYLYDIGTAAAHDEDSIMNEFIYAQRVLGCDVFLVDNIMTARLKGDRDYYRAQSLFAQRLAQFCKSSHVHLHLVAHPRKTEHNKPVEDSDDVSGTGDITNMADNVISVRRLKEPGDDGREAELAVLKSRERGVMGTIGLMFNPASRRFFPVRGADRRVFGWEQG